MNATRRKLLEKIGATLIDAKTELEEIQTNEQDYLDNMPENLQTSDKYTTSKEAINAMESVISNLEDAIECINSAQD